MKNTFTLLRRILAGGAFALMSSHTCAQVPIGIDTRILGDEISPTLYGIFFEEIKFAGCGGLYAELVRNRSFEDDRGENLWYWDAQGAASMEVVTTDAEHSNMINEVQEHAVKVSAHVAYAGIRNQGYWGMNIEKGVTYQLSFWAKSDDVTGITARLFSPSGSLLGQAKVTEQLTGEWTRYTASIKATRSDTRGQLALVATKASTFYLDVVSLFPPTYMDRPNGMRRDLAELTADLKPAFMRFPGGCVIEGLYDSQTGKTCRVEWKKQLGPIENRLGHRNNNWGYCVDDGMGVYEYFQFAEDIGAEPLWVANLGCGHNWKVDYLHNEEALQETLDLIEFANGAVDTPFGKIRAEMGHPEPFGLKYIELGNEQNETSDGDTRDHYGERYLRFYKAIKAVDPTIQVIGCGQYNEEGWQYAHPVDMVDGHHYHTPDYFFNSLHMYDNWDCAKHKLYIGEYAVTWGAGTIGNLRAALAEAVYMMGMERNGDVVKMASYAPMFSNDDSPAGWPTEMMHYNSSQSFGTPSYYIQKLFPHHRGTVNVAVTNDRVTIPEHTVGLLTWNTAISATDLSVVDNETGEAIVTSDQLAATANWTTNGQWTIADGVWKQEDTQNNNLAAYHKQKFASSHYTYQAKITKQKGQEGFIVPFYYIDNDNWYRMNIGGWGNVSAGLEQNIGGTTTIVDGTVPCVIQTGKEYDVRVVVDSLDVTLYLDGQKILQRTIQSPARPTLYTTANLNESGEVNLRIVNTNNEAKVAVIDLNDYVTSVGGEYLGGIDANAENNFSSPRRVIPKDITGAEFEGKRITYTVPRNSACFLTIGTSETPVEVAVKDVRNGEKKTRKSSVYTLQGTQVDTIPRHGVYIADGKKVVK
ncbi:MAG: carbohydrate binding domain-containing protein [Bacteroidaceae bacterium]|nr:carbohydrate binding domain-containing protein [Bacteroidaceae bacterium]